MKTEYTNAEKVSSNFIEFRCNEMLQRFGEFIYGHFKEKIEAIKISDEDNYEKLKRLIHLENEIEEYMASKKVILDIIILEFNGAQPSTSPNISDDEFNIRIPTYINEYLAIGISEKCWDEQVSQEQKSQVCKYFSKKYLKDMPVSKLLAIIGTLNEADRNTLIVTIQEYYKEQFKIQIIDSEIRDIRPTAFYHPYLDEIFSKLPDNVFLFIARAFVNAYLEKFNYDENDMLATEFKGVIQKATWDSDVFFKLIKAFEFWNLLLTFDIFYQKLHENSKLNFMNSNNSASTQLPAFSKVTLEELPKIASSKIFCNLDFRGLDLSEVDFTGATFQNCNLAGTNAHLDFREINLNDSVYYVRGQKIERNNFVSSCFKGCTITGLTDEKLSTFTFSIDTFDKEVLEQQGFWLKDVDESLLDKYYKRQPLTISEASLFHSRGFFVGLRYLNISSEPSYNWICIYSRLFKDEASKLMEVVNES